MLVLAVASAAAGLLAGPAAAGSGGSYTVPLIGSAPTIDGAVGTIEWSGATSFPATFAGRPATAYVARTATDLYFALAVDSPAQAAPGSSAFYFDNNDNGVTEVGDDIKFINSGGTPQDFHAIDASFSSVPDAINDTFAAQSYAGGVDMFEYKTALCSGDANDFCFLPPTTATSSKLGFTIAYGPASGGASLSPAGILDPAGYAEFLIAPDTTPPPAPNLSVTGTSSAFYNSATSVLWYRGGTSGSFTLVASGTDPESGIDHANLPGFDTTPALPFTWDTGASPTPTSLTYYFPDSTASPAPPGLFGATLVNGAGLEGPPTKFTFNTDSTQPTGGIDCSPAGCSSANAPVTVTVSATDNGGSGIKQLRYTTNGVDPGPDSGTVIAPGGSFEVTTPNRTVKVWAIDKVGNAGPVASASVSGSPFCGVLGNCGFENALPDPQNNNCDPAVTARVTFGNWLPFYNCNNPTAPSLIDGPQHSGINSGEVVSSTSPSLGNGAFFLQDVPNASFDPNQGFELTTWVNLAQGSTQGLLLFDWDRGVGNTVGTAGFTVGESSISFGAWGQSKSFEPGISLNGWHELRLHADAGTFTSTLSLDGEQVSSITTTGSAYKLSRSFPNPHTALLLGDACGTCTAPNRAYFDDTSLIQLVAPDPPQAGPIFTVNTDADHADAAGCTQSDCTLREAIDAANAHAGSDTVNFAIPGAGQHLISLGTALPPLIDNGTTIDGYTQTGATQNTLDSGFNAVLPIVLDGTAVVGVNPSALDIRGSGNTIQGLAIGTSLGARFDNAIRVSGQTATDNVIRGNAFGTPLAPSATNRLFGVDVRGGASNTIIGGAIPAEHNSFVENGLAGISISSSGIVGGLPTRGTQVIGNFIFANRVGILIQDGAVSSRIIGNVISSNGTPGVGGQGIDVEDGPDGASVGNLFSQNSIHDNAALGIDLAGDGVTQNDTGDIDTGPNTLQNFPILGVPIFTDSSLTVAARLSSLPSTQYLIEAFGNTTCDASGYGEGETYLGSTNVTTDRLGVATVSLGVEIGTAPGGVTLTATELKNHNTSEFSQCRQPQVAGTTTSSSVSLASNTASSEAGASIVTLAGIPRSAFGPPPAPIESSPIESSPIESSPIESSPIESSPIESSPIESSPIESSPIESSPIESSPIESSGFTKDNLKDNRLGGVPLSDLPLLHGKTWSGIIGRDVPEQSTTLADAFALSPRPLGLKNLTVGDIDWAHSNSPLASLGVGAFALGPALLQNLPPIGDPSKTPLQRWCKTIGDLHGFSCDPNNAGDIANLATKTVMDIALEGVPIESSGLGTVPIESSNLAGTPIESSPIESSNLVGTPIESSALSAINMSVSPFGNIPLTAVLAQNLNSPLRNLPLSAVPSGLFTCAACGTKLGGAVVDPAAKVRDLGAALATFTVGDLKTYPGVTFGNIGRGLPAEINIRDLLRALFATVPFDPETLPLAGIQTIADAGGLVTYTATLTLQGTGVGTAFAQLRASIPAAARYKQGSTIFTGGGITPVTNDPGVMSTGELGWSLNGLTYGTTYQLRFQVYPGLQLGTDTTSVTLLPLGLPAQTALPVNVAVTDTFEGVNGNNTPATATPVQAGKLYLSFEQTQADTDWYSLPVPPAGSVTTIKLSHLTNDKDLVVYAPSSAPLRSAPIESSPIESSPIESSTVLDPAPTLQHATGRLQPAAVQDVPIESSQLTNRVVAGVSDNPGTTTDSVAIVSTGAPAGSTYLIHVAATDPTPTNDPYVLHIDQQQPGAPVACPTQRTFPFPGGGTAGTLPAFGTVPAATKTMILVDYKRIGDTYGAAALATLKAKLTAFAARADIAGVVLPVEGSAAVQTAYNQWDTGGQSCSPESANNVVRAIISNVVDPFRAGHPNVKFLVIAGGDDIVPFPRVPDNTTTANESSYVGTIGYPKDALGNPVPTNNELVGTAASSYMQTDDVWSAFNPTPLLNTPLYLPQWATGRLVETADQIGKQIDAYGTGTINPTTQLTAGYGFLADSSLAVAQSLKTFAPGGPGDLINPPNAWTHSQLLTQLQLGNAASPQIVTINAHYDHHRALPGNGDQTDLFNSTELTQPLAPLNAELGRLIFSIGCHSGYSVPNVFYTAPFSLDWPEADFAAGAIARVANTTYGYGDTEVIGYSESVEVAFASRLNQMTLGEALLYAKQQYIADLGTVGPFEQKAVNALTFYGLPMLHIGTPGGPGTPPTPPATTTDPITGLQSLAVTSLVPTFTEKTAADGSRYFTGPNGVDATNGRPFEPKKIVADITQPGTMPHGFLLTGLGLNAPSQHYPAARSRAIPDAAGLTPALSSEVGWPSSLSRIGSFASPTGPRQQLVLIHGQFLSDSDSDTSGTGTQTNFNRIAGNVLYSPSKDAIPPQLAKIRVTSVASTVAFELDATDATSTADNPPSGTVKAVVVVYYEPGASTAKTILLSQTPNTSHWSGGGPLSSSSVHEINYVIQAVDLAGNVGLSVHKVVAAPIVLQPPAQGNLTITPTTPVGPSGWFGGDVRVALASTTPGFTTFSYSIDGGALTHYTAAFLVQGDGIHLVDAVAENAAGDEIRASAAVAIDSKAPAITILSPVDGQYALVGDHVKALYSCLDSGIGLAATNGCVGTVAIGADIDTGTPGTKTFTVTAKDALAPALGHTFTKSVSYTVWRAPGDAIVALANKTLLYLKQAPIGVVLKAYLTQAANEFVANHKPAACALLNLYIAGVNAVPANVLTVAQKADLVADATRIKTLIGCTT